MNAFEAAWAKRFEDANWRYLFKPLGMRKWPTYHAQDVYQVSFTLLNYAGWEWASVKQTEDPIDLGHLRALVTFDAKHQRAFQCIGPPDNAIINIVTWRRDCVQVARVNP